MGRNRYQVIPSLTTKRDHDKDRGTRTKIGEPKTPYHDEPMEVEEEVSHQEVDDDEIRNVKRLETHLQ